MHVDPDVVARPNLQLDPNMTDEANEGKGGMERALRILSALARAGSGVSLAALEELTALPQSTLYRQLAALRRWGFVINHRGEFSPGPMCLPLAWGFEQSSFLTRDAHAGLEALSSQSGESVGLMVASNDQVICLDMVESSQPLRCSFVKGRVLPLLGKGATAKALMAFSQRAKPGATVGKRVHLAHAGAGAATKSPHPFDQIRAQGYAVSDSEVDEGVWGVSAPLYQRPGAEAIAVITLMAPSSRARGSEERFIQGTVRGAARISSALQSY